MIKILLTATFFIMGVLGLYVSFGNMVLMTKYFKKSIWNRVYLKLINRNIENAPSPVAKEKLIQLKKVYLAFLFFLYLFCLLFVLNIIVVNWK